jgi:hypothetical protein
VSAHPPGRVRTGSLKEQLFCFCLAAISQTIGTCGGCNIQIRTVTVIRRMQSPTPTLHCFRPSRATANFRKFVSAFFRPSPPPRPPSSCAPPRGTTSPSPPTSSPRTKQTLSRWTAARPIPRSPVRTRCRTRRWTRPSAQSARPLRTPSLTPRARRAGRSSRAERRTLLTYFQCSGNGCRR